MSHKSKQRRLIAKQSGSWSDKQRNIEKYRSIAQSMGLREDPQTPAYWHRVWGVKI